MDPAASAHGQVASMNGGLWRACRELASTADSTQQQHRGRQYMRSDTAPHLHPTMPAPAPPAVPRSLSAPPQHYEAASPFYEQAQQPRCPGSDAAAALARMHEQQLTMLSAQQQEQQAWCEAAMTLVLGTPPVRSSATDSLPSLPSSGPAPVRCSAPPELGSGLGPVIAEMWHKAEQRAAAESAESRRALAAREAAATAAVADERLRAEQAAWQAQRAREQAAWEERRRWEEAEAHQAWQARRHELLLQQAAHAAASQVQPPCLRPAAQPGLPSNTSF